MRLITRFELATSSASELHQLLSEIFNALARTGAGTPARRNALASLENIQRELTVQDRASNGAAFSIAGCATPSHQTIHPERVWGY